MTDMQNLISDIKSILAKYEDVSVPQDLSSVAVNSPIKLLTADKCLKLFGKPETEAFMTLWDVPTNLEIGAIPKRIYCHKLLVKPLENAFSRLIQTGCVAELKTWDGCFNIRTKRGSNSYSLHSWGLAIDVNASWNPMGKPGNLSKDFVECFTQSGFNWGGSWKLPDPMHFELKDELAG